jgi:hypothetical protein
MEPPERGRVVVIPQVGGLHHRYRRRDAQLGQASYSFLCRNSRGPIFDPGRSGHGVRLTSFNARPTEFLVATAGERVEEGIRSDFGPTEIRPRLVLLFADRIEEDESPDV